MTINDKAVITPALGYVFFAPVGTDAPTPKQLADLDISTLAEDGGPITPISEPDTGEGDTKPKTADVKPVGKNALPAAWINAGHTARDTLPEFGYEGGDTEVRGTWQNESLREVETKPLADSIKLQFHQFDADTLELYYGKNASTTAGVFGVKGGPSTPIERALLIIIVDGEEKIGFHASKTSLRRDESIKLKTDEFGAFPVKGTFLNLGAKLKYSWINEDLF